MSFLRLREPRDLHSDPAFVYMVGRLIGCAEMLTRYLQIHGDDQGKQMGERADQVLQFFYDESRPTMYHE